MYHACRELATSHEFATIYELATSHELAVSLQQTTLVKKARRSTFPIRHSPTPSPQHHLPNTSPIAAHRLPATSQQFCDTINKKSSDVLGFSIVLYVLAKGRKSGDKIIVTYGQ